VARLLAERLGWPWRDADAMLEERSGKSVRTIFAEEGEVGFRDREEAVLAELCRQEPLVVATGGGVVVRTTNRALLRASGWCVWLRADADTLWQRMCADASTPERRPALGGGGRAEVVEILRCREPLYRACADLIVETAGRTPEAVAEEILPFSRDPQESAVGPASPPVTRSPTGRG
jgi:shikimate kinase